MAISFGENKTTHSPSPKRPSRPMRSVRPPKYSLSRIFSDTVAKITKYKSLKQFQSAKSFKKDLEKLSVSEQKEALEQIEKNSASMEKEFDYFHLLPFNKFSDHVKNKEQIFETLKSNTLSPQEQLIARAKYVALSELIDKIDNPNYQEAGYCIRAQKEALERRLKKKGLIAQDKRIDTPEAIDEMIDFYLKNYLSLSKNDNASAPLYASCSAMALRFNRQKDPLSQKMAKHMSFLENLAHYQRQTHTSIKKETILKKQIQKMLNEDGFAFIPLRIHSPSQQHSGHAMCGVLKRSQDAGIKLYLQDTNKEKNITSSHLQGASGEKYIGTKGINAELLGSNDNERLDNIMHICRQRGEFNTEHLNNHKILIEELHYPPTECNESPIYFKDIFRNIEESEKRLNWHQTRKNCHIAGLHCALALAARLNAETPDDSGIPKVKGLTPETLAKDVQQLQYADEANAYYHVIYKLRRNAKQKKAERALQEKAVIEEEAPTE